MQAAQFMTLTIMAAAGAVIGGLAVPRFSDALLKQKIARWREWFDRCAEGWAAFAEAEGRKPAAKASGEEGALAIWAEDALRLAAQGALDEERAAKVAALGLDDEEKEKKRSAVRREVDALAASAKAAAKASLPKGGGA